MLAVSGVDGLNSDRFRVLGLVGQGATGRVYRVHDQELGRDVALKTMHRPGPDQLLRIKREFRARAGLAHRNLVQLHELFVDERACFFTMELVEGQEFVRWARGEAGLGGTSTTLGSVVESVAAQVPAPPGGPPRMEGASPPEPPLAVGLGALGGSPGAADVSRLRDCILQLLHGLQALHGSGRVHRDVKPSNVLVTGADRLVLLDFGLVAELDEAALGGTARREIAGTPAYMAPEQVRAAAVTPATDLYAVGAMLYEALTGAFPFAADRARLLELKLQRTPAPVRELAPEVPAELAELTMALLRIAPEDRPSLEECLALLDSGRSGGFPSKSPPAAAPGASARTRFVGRARELSVLSEALTEVADHGRQLTVHLQGPSGIGKSTLAREFLVLARQRGAPAILQGRCHSQERVPYKALDAVIDNLVRYLDGLPVEEAAALLPARAYALAALFPVLGRLAAFQRTASPATVSDPVELRQHGFVALRELLERLAHARGPLILWIDDVQWTDADSTLLFEELLRPPAPPLLLLLSSRSEARDKNPLLRRLLEAGQTGSLRELTLGALGEGEVEELARQLLPQESGVRGDAHLESIVAQAQGNPFITCELARRARQPAAAGAGLVAQVDVARLVLERIQALPPEQRALLEVASVAVRPIARSLALQAAGLDAGARLSVAWLRDSGLLREIPDDDEIAIATYHDRIREALLDALPEAERARRHRGLAEALTARGSSDFEALLTHWEGAGDRPRAGEYAVLSADRAAQALAFDNAAELYEKALGLLGPRADRPTLLEKLAQALSNRGRAPEAAQRYLEAAEALGGALSHTRVSDLKRRAADQYLKSGQLARGWREMESVLRALDIPVPRSPLGAIGMSLWRRLLFMLRRLDVRGLVPRPVTPEERRLLDVLWAATTGWTLINAFLGDAFRTMHLLRVLRTGEASGVCRALLIEASMEFYLGGGFFERHARRLMEQARELVERSGDPYDRAWYESTQLHQAFNSWRYREMVEACERADAIYRNECTGVAWERVTLAMYHFPALVNLGELPKVHALMDEFCRDAALRGDVHASCEPYLNDSILAWIARGRVDEARARTQETLSAQLADSSTWPVNAYRRQQFGDLVASTYTACYRGDPWPAWKDVLEHWGPLKSSSMHVLQGTGLMVRHTRARAALAAAAQLPDDRSRPPEGIDPKWTRRRLLADVHEQLRPIERSSIGCARPIAHFHRAGLAWARADRAMALQELEQAIAGFTGEGMVLLREVLRYVLGELRGGRGGQELQREVLEWMAGQQIARPRAFVAAVAPGFGILPG